MLVKSIAASGKTEIVCIPERPSLGSAYIPKVPLSTAQSADMDWVQDLFAFPKKIKPFLFNAKALVQQ